MKIPIRRQDCETKVSQYRSEQNGGYLGAFDD